MSIVNQPEPKTALRTVHSRLIGALENNLNNDRHLCIGRPIANAQCCPSHRCMIFCGSAYIALVGDVERASLHAGIR